MKFNFLSSFAIFLFLLISFTACEKEALVNEVEGNGGLNVIGFNSSVNRMDNEYCEIPDDVPASIDLKVTDVTDNLITYTLYYTPNDNYSGIEDVLNPVSVDALVNISHFIEIRGFSDCLPFVHNNLGSQSISGCLDFFVIRNDCDSFFVDISASVNYGSSQYVYDFSFNTEESLIPMGNGYAVDSDDVSSENSSIISCNTGIFCHPDLGYSTTGGPGNGHSLLSMYP